MVSIRPGDGLLIADIQRDFLPGGTLGVRGGDEIVPVLLRYAAVFQSKGLPIFATRDWHPANHCSFRENGGIWPVHCVAGSAGADPPSEFQLPLSAVIIHKATAPDKEAYSAFQDTELHQCLCQAGVQRLLIGGLATEYCVLNTVKDALALGYRVCLLVDAIRAVNLHSDDGRAAEEEMGRLGVAPVRLETVAG